MTMAGIDATPSGGVRRLALGDENRAARDPFGRWRGETGSLVRVDDLGNICGRREGSASDSASGGGERQHARRVSYADPHPNLPDNC